MKPLHINRNPAVGAVFEKYPEEVRKKMHYLRGLVIAAAEEAEGVTELEETLKWGEPSFLTKKGSTIRMDWKPKSPERYAFYFQCTSRLVSTFKLAFGELFEYEGNRAVVFRLDSELPEQALKQCLTAALRYHKVKHLPLLGI